jgi:hypothetical protein
MALVADEHPGVLDAARQHIHLGQEVAGDAVDGRDDALGSAQHRERVHGLGGGVQRVHRAARNRVPAGRRHRDDQRLGLSHRPVPGRARGAGVRPLSRLEEHYLPDLDWILDAVGRAFGY